MNLVYCYNNPDYEGTAGRSYDYYYRYKSYETQILPPQAPPPPPPDPVPPPLNWDAIDLSFFDTI